MTTTRATALTMGLVASLLVAALHWPAASAAAVVPLAPSIVVVAGNGLTGLIHTVPVGGGISMEVTLSFQNLGGLADVQTSSSLPGVDVYVGAILPGGRFMSWVGDPQGTTFAISDAPVPLFAGIIPEETTQYFWRPLRFADDDAQGWYVLYGLVVRAGANPLDPREWSGWNPTSFYPFFVAPRVTR